jgi:hypothetical protein
VKLIVTIDTEEDNWAPYSPTGYTVRNIERLPALQDLFAAYDVRPTYLVTYQVVTHAGAADILDSLVHSEQCEIGAHCHPWSTPPFTEDKVERNSMLCNLPPVLQVAKIRSLHAAILSRLGVSPTSFRSGRWGYSPTVAATLHALGYRVDTSITAYTDWRYCDGPDHSEMSPAPFLFSPEEIYRPHPTGCMLQVPATVGYLQRDFALSNALVNGIRRSSLRHLRLIGALDRMGWVNKVWLSPENSTGTQMMALARRMRDSGYPLVNMFFHSSTLTAGLTPFVRDRQDEVWFLERIREFLAFAQEEGFESITLSEARALYPTPGVVPSAAAACG